MEQRLQLFLQMEQISQSQFADKMGIQRSGVTHLLSGRNKPSFDFIARMLQAYPSLNAEWLILGKGKPYKEQSDNQAAELIMSETPIVGDNDLFSAPAEPETYVKTESISESKKPEIPETKEFRVIEANPRQSKGIESILILYEDGTYEKR